MPSWSEIVTVVVSIASAIYASERVYYYKRDEQRDERMAKAHEDIAVILARVEHYISKDDHDAV